MLSHIVFYKDPLDLITIGKKIYIYVYIYTYIYIYIYIPLSAARFISAFLVCLAYILKPCFKVSAPPPGR